MFLNYKFFITVLLGIFFIPKMSSQDIHFSQFDLSPMYISPVLTGYMEGGTDRKNRSVGGLELSLVIVLIVLNFIPLKKGKTAAAKILILKNSHKISAPFEKR